MNQRQLDKWDETKKAIRAGGVEAAPYIVRKLKANDSAWKREYRSSFPRFPPWLRKILPAPKEEFTDDHGTSAFLAIGPSVKPALIAALKNDSTLVRSAAAHAVGLLAHYEGTDIRDAVPALIDSLRDSDAGVRSGSARALGFLGPDADEAVPALIPLLKDPEEGREQRSVVFVRSTAATALGKIGPKAKSALPQLRNLLKDQDPYRRSVAAVAIWRIDADVTNTLPVLIQGLNANLWQSNWELIEGLQEMGPLAKAAVPALLEQLKLRGTPNAPSASTRARITNALVRIDAEAAANAGVRLPADQEETK